MWRTIACLFIVLLACNKTGKKDAVAKVGDKVLTWEEVKSIVPDDTSPKDSAMLAERYIQEWVKQEVVLRHAEQNLSEEQKNVDELIDNYRKSLVLYTYEQELVKQRLDTNVKEEEIEKYYYDNLQNFQLKDYIVKVKYCAISTDNKQIKLLRKLFFSVDPQDLVKWEKFCVENGASYFFDEDKWMIWDDFMQLQQVPLNVVDKDAFLKRNRDIEFDKDNNLYLLRVVDYQISGSQSPLSFEHEKIRDILMNNRKQQLLSNMRQFLYNQALNDQSVEIYTTKK
jgi:hypothetical protein